MTFASFRQILVLTLLTVLLFFGIDRIKHPHREELHGEPMPLAGADSPTIRLRLNDSQCGGCLTTLQTTLAQVPWLGPSKVVDVPPAAEPAPGSDHRQQLVVESRIPPEDVGRVDFVTVLAALRKAGFAPAQMEFSGLPHYGLEADVPPLCSPVCVEGTRNAMDDLVRASRPKGWFRWLDSYSVNPVNRSLVIYPRIGETVDIMEVLGAINTIGFEASALTVQVHGAR